MRASEVPLKRVATIKYGLGQPPPLVDSGVPIIRATNIYRGSIIPQGLIFADPGDLPLHRVPLLQMGEVLVVRTGAYTGDSALVTSEWVGAAPGYDLRVTPGPGLDPRFLAYSLLARRALDQMGLATSRAAQPHLNAEELGDVTIWCPSRRKQYEIANYLDRRLGRISALVSKKRRLVSLLQERVESLVRHHIAGSGLVASTPGTSSKPIKRLLEKVNRPAPQGGRMVTAFRDGQVTARALRRAEGYTESWSDDPHVQGVLKGDIVIHGLDGFAGAIGVSEVDGVCSPVYHVCTPKKDVDALFLARMLRILAVSGYLGLFASSTRERAVDFRNWDLFGRIPIPDVDPFEQRKIANSIRRISPLKAAVERSEELANEYRHALITAAVNDELDVFGSAA